MYEFGENAKDEKSRAFFGKNSGKYNDESTGILKSQNNVFQTRCESIGKYSPYFNETVIKNLNIEFDY
jgi:hypothetical protein